MKKGIFTNFSKFEDVETAPWEKQHNLNAIDLISESSEVGTTIRNIPFSRQSTLKKLENKANVFLEFENHIILFIFVVSIINLTYYDYEKKLKEKKKLGTEGTLIIQTIVSVVLTLIMAVKISIFPQYSARTFYTHQLLILDFLSGPLALVISLFALFLYHPLLFATFFFNQISIFAQFSIRMGMINMWMVMKKIGRFVALIFMVMLVFTVAAHELFKEKDKHHFGNIFTTFLSILQIITYDDWSIMNKNIFVHYGLITFLFFFASMVFFNFIMMNILMATIVDLYSMESQNEMTGIDYEFNNSSIESILMGKSYDFLVTSLYLLSVGEIFCTKFVIMKFNFDNDVYTIRKIAFLVYSTLFTIHFIFFVWYKRKFKGIVLSDQQIIILSKRNLFIHFLTGPFSLVFGILQFFINFHDILFILVFLKVFTTNYNAKVLYTIPVLVYRIYPVIVLLFGIIFINSLVMIEIPGEKKHFGDFGTSINSFLQIVTFDGWIQIINKNGFTIRDIFIIVFSIFSGFVIISLITAKTCMILGQVSRHKHSYLSENAEVFHITRTSIAETVNLLIDIFIHKCPNFGHSIEKTQYSMVKNSILQEYEINLKDEKKLTSFMMRKEPDVLLELEFEGKKIKIPLKKLKLNKHYDLY